MWLVGNLKVNSAGVVCRGWSGLGSHMRFSHESEIPHAIYLSERSAMAETGGEHLFSMECTKMYPAILKMQLPLEDVSKSHKFLFIKTGPELLGQPVSRPRVHGVGIALKHMVWVGPQTSQEVQEDFHALFGFSCE